MTEENVESLKVYIESIESKNRELQTEIDHLMNEIHDLKLDIQYLEDERNNTWYGSNC